MKPIKLISLDLDGTVLRNDKTISNYTRDVLARCREKGIIIAVNTGRNALVCKRLLPYINPHVMITSGGAAARFGNGILYNEAMPAETANEVIRRSLVHPNLTDIILDMPGGYFAENLLEPSNPLYIDYCKHSTQTDFANPVEGEVYVIGMLCSNPKAMLEITEGLPGVFPAEPENSVWRAVQSTKTDKWLALKAAAERFSISAEETAAFGDDWNDLTQLRGAGRGVVMGNARDFVKKTAREVCGTNEEDGAARWIEKNILNEK